MKDTFQGKNASPIKEKHTWPCPCDVFARDGIARWIITFPQLKL